MVLDPPTALAARPLPTGLLLSQLTARTSDSTSVAVRPGVGKGQP